MENDARRKESEERRKENETRCKDSESRRKESEDRRGESNSRSKEKGVSIRTNDDAKSNENVAGRKGIDSKTNVKDAAHNDVDAKHKEIDARLKEIDANAKENDAQVKEDKSDASLNNDDGGNDGRSNADVGVPAIPETTTDDERVDVPEQSVLVPSVPEAETSERVEELQVAHAHQVGVWQANMVELLAEHKQLAGR